MRHPGVTEPRSDRTEASCTRTVLGGTERDRVAPWDPARGDRAGENGHVISNGDMTPKAGVEATPQNGTGSAEPPKEESEAEAGAADSIEPAPAAAEPAGDGAATPKDAPKKKKKFSFKKPFKLSGISFRKGKKEAGDSSGSSPTEERGGSSESPPGGLQPSAPPEEQPGEPQDGGEAAGRREEEEEEEEKKQQRRGTRGLWALGEQRPEGIRDG
ncbi:MARCKS-related protein [Passer montanus]|uniref:MARCKS-related protein n=1 Tax=Passer montanus TaxID=9160 RepID=UPI0019603FE8|nr:MARCKS-related protein [Passer montanus]